MADEGGPVRKILTAAFLAVLMTAPISAQKAYKVGEDGVKAPKLIREVKPRYTESAMNRNVQGTVEVNAVVLSDGTVGDVTIKRSLDAELDEEAIKATKQWRFSPGTKDDQPVDVQVTIELTFTLRK
jgi:TonB family protein